MCGGGTANGERLLTADAADRNKALSVLFRASLDRVLRSAFSRSLSVYVCRALERKKKYENDNGKREAKRRKTIEQIIEQFPERVFHPVSVRIDQLPIGECRNEDVPLLRRRQNEISVCLFARAGN